MEAEANAAQGETSRKAVSSASKSLTEEGYNSDEDVTHRRSNYQILSDMVRSPNLPSRSLTVAQYSDSGEEFEDEDSVVTVIDSIEEIHVFFETLLGKAPPVWARLMCSSSFNQISPQGSQPSSKS